jgi:putative transposase
MTRYLERFQTSGQSHFVTFSCYHRLPNLADCRIRDEFLITLESERKRCGARVYGFVVMPEHVHLLVSEPARGKIADFIRSMKVSMAKRAPILVAGLEEDEPFWQPRYYDRNIRSYSDFLEKLRYIHRNPVKRGLCLGPEQWQWSSFRHYATGESCLVEIESEWTARERRVQKI